MTSRVRPAIRALLAIAFVVTPAAIVACDDAPRADLAEAAARTAPATGPVAGVVDSALPIAELLARFRAQTTDTPTVLAGGADSPEALARALLAALRSQDTAAVRRLTISRGEFAWLYYPHTRFTAPPYTLGPELVWLTTIAASEKGAGRLFARYGGRDLRLDGVECPARPEREGPNMVLRGCRVRLAAADSAARDLQLFGAVLAREGRYKFLSFANDL